MKPEQYVSETESLCKDLREEIDCILRNADEHELIIVLQFIKPMDR